MISMEADETSVDPAGQCRDKRFSPHPCDELRSCLTGCIQAGFEHFEMRIRGILQEELHSFESRAIGQTFAGQKPIHKVAIPSRATEPSGGGTCTGAQYRMRHPRLLIGSPDRDSGNFQRDSSQAIGQRDTPQAIGQRDSPQAIGQQVSSQAIGQRDGPQAIGSATPRNLDEEGQPSVSRDAPDPSVWPSLNSDDANDDGEHGSELFTRFSFGRRRLQLPMDCQIPPASALPLSHPSGEPAALYAQDAQHACFSWFSHDSSAAAVGLPHSLLDIPEQDQSLQRQWQQQQLQNPAQHQPQQSQHQPQPQQPQQHRHQQQQQSDSPSRTNERRCTMYGASRDVSNPECWEAIVKSYTTSNQSSPILARASSRVYLNVAEVESFSFREKVRDVVYSWQFEYVHVFLVVAHAILMGVESDYASRNLEFAIPSVYELVEAGFCAVFTLEVALRIYVSRSRFFDGPGYRWNIVDCLTVCIEIALLCLSSTLRWSASSLNVLRLVRLFRLVRIVRAMQVLTQIGQVRWVISSFVTSVKPVGGAIAILGFTNYVLSIYLLEVVMLHRVRAGPGSESTQQLGHHFGSLFMCMLTLWQAISGGLDWGELFALLVEHVSPLAGCALALYIAFALLALMNTITGLFTDGAVRVAKEDQEMYILRRLRHLFAQMDSDGKGRVGWEEFERGLQQSHMQELFNVIGLDASEAECMFKLIDIDDTGVINVEDFLSGCIRLKGEAKALDLLLFTKETRRQLGCCFMQMQALQTQLEALNGGTGD